MNINIHINIHDVYEHMRYVRRTCLGPFIKSSSAGIFVPLFRLLQITVKLLFFGPPHEACRREY